MERADALAQRVAAAMLSREGTGPAWAIAIDEARAGYARIRMAVRPDMANGHGIAHGGMVFALADTAFAYACNSDNQVTVAAHASIAFLSPARVGETLVAEAQQTSGAGRSGVSRVVVTAAGDGRTIAEFTGLSRRIGGTIVDPLGDAS